MKQKVEQLPKEEMTNEAAAAAEALGLHSITVEAAGKTFTFQEFDIFTLPYAMKLVGKMHQRGLNTYFTPQGKQVSEVSFEKLAINGGDELLALIALSCELASIDDLDKGPKWKNVFKGMPGRFMPMLVKALYESNTLFFEGVADLIGWGKGQEIANMIRMTRAMGASMEASLEDDEEKPDQTQTLPKDGVFSLEDLHSQV